MIRKLNFRITIKEQKYSLLWKMKEKVFYTWREKESSKKGTSISFQRRIRRIQMLNLSRNKRKEKLRT